MKKYSWSSIVEENELTYDDKDNKTMMDTLYLAPVMMVYANPIF